MPAVMRNWEGGNWNMSVPQRKGMMASDMFMDPEEWLAK